ncbi:MAG: T9SS type A sorting domain-containing protein [Bacteroidota bacterium]|nr:T9SS type A sorting domain-containing protein [Bacteroidota bacterium]MDP4234302.1 T9SS type A sorting domain-containing protein [Bacteroidota bacterium]MDP4243236.1 T9SS type A sorting domain-containing protein [Bacteroidota bacterium]MDP4288057.1 T9SS type A sorting domain-containing protein [Bacteroidota bacterium]
MRKVNSYREMDCLRRVLESVRVMIVACATLILSLQAPQAQTLIPVRHNFQPPTSEKKGNLPLSMLGEVDTCTYLNNLSGALLHDGYYQQCYDTTKLYLKNCYELPGAEGNFCTTDAANQNRSKDPNRFVEYREWLKSVLYLRPDSDWYCSDVGSILHTFIYYPGKGLYINGQIAIARYVLEHSHCDTGVMADFRLADSTGIPMIYSIWRDTVKDSLREPRPDTTIPSIDSIGLSILRGPEYAEVTTRPKGTDLRVTSIRATENPFTKATEIVVELADYGLVKFELFDALGNLVASNGGLGQVLEPGEHTFEVDGSKLPSGTYFARIAYHNGDVKTIMLNKE